MMLYLTIKYVIATAWLSCCRKISLTGKALTIKFCFKFIKNNWLSASC